MFLLDWLRQYYEIKAEHKRLQRENTICESCETLKHELEVVRLENEKLIDRILEKPVEEPRVDVTNLKPIIPKNVPWRMRREMLEAEDRAKAKLVREAITNTTKDTSSLSGGQQFQTAANTEQPMTVEALEKELGVEDAG